MSDGYVLVNSDNLHRVTRELKFKRGKLLLYRPSISCSYDGGVMTGKFLTGEAHFHLFGNANILDQDKVVASPVNHRDSRDYFLRKKVTSNDSSWESAYRLFDVLRVGKEYSFEVHGLFISSCGLFEDGDITASIYIPKRKGYELDALGFAIRKFSEQIIAQEGEKAGVGDFSLEKILSYVNHDLETGEFLEHNIAACQEASNLLGT